MRGQQQSTTRRLNRHYQSGGKPNFFITTSGTASEPSRCYGYFTKNPSAQVLKIDDKLVLELTPVKAERNGSPVSIPVIYTIPRALGLSMSFSGGSSQQSGLYMQDPNTYEYSVPTSGNSQFNPNLAFWGPFKTSGATVFEADNIGQFAPGFPSSVEVFGGQTTNIVYKRANPNPENTIVYYKYRLYVVH